MAKGRKKRIDPAAKFALVFALVFAIAVAVLIPVMTRYSAQKLQENITRAEAERQYRLDLSWIDSDMKLGWIARQGNYELDAAGEWDYIGSVDLLRTYDFASRSYSDIPIEIEDADELMLVPSDDPRGYVLVGNDLNSDAWSVCRMDENGKVIPGFYEINKDIQEIIGFYDGRLYCHVYEDYAALDWDTHLVSWNSQTKDTHHYRGKALCLNPDGSALILQKRDTGLYETYYDHYNENGKFMSVEKQRKIWGYTLGIEDAQGNWSPLLNTGRDSALMYVRCASWLDEDRLLLAASLPSAQYTYALYIYTLSEGEISAVTTPAGESIYLYEEPITGSMTVSPDGRYITYQVVDSGFKYDNWPYLMIQSLENGRYAQICPEDDVIDGNRRMTIDVEGSLDNQIWTQ